MILCIDFLVQSSVWLSRNGETKIRCGVCSLFKYKLEAENSA